MSAGTVGENSQVNQCGIESSHAYAIIEVFNMINFDTLDTYSMVMIRNPMGTTNWNGKWSHSDSESWNAYPNIK